MRTPELIAFKATDPLALRLHVFQPDEPGEPRPAAVFFSCGGWSGFHPPKFYPHCDYLAGRGMMGISAEVRSLGHGAESPATCVIDARSAVRWVRAHVADLAVDPNRIAAGGGSAGGHVAACTALPHGPDEPGDDTSVRCVPDALILFNPVLDLTTLARRVNLFGGPEGARALSPQQHLRPGWPPAVVFHGDADETVRVDQAHRFAEAMRAAGNRCDLHTYEGQEHGFFNYFDGENPMFAETVRGMDRFLASLGWIEGEPAIDAYVYEGPSTAAPRIPGGL
jgi:acetyl esterase/lipase